MVFKEEQHITHQQMELLKSLKFLKDKKDFDEVRELLALYYEHKLDAAIDKVEKDRSYSKEVYENWLSRQRNNKA